MLSSTVGRLEESGSAVVDEQRASPIDVSGQKRVAG